MNRLVSTCDQTALFDTLLPPDRPLVSVVVPMYRVEAFVERCIVSILTQTYRPIQVIIVDDKSPDGSRAKAERVIARYRAEEECKILSFSQNRGSAIARQVAMEEAEGRYLFFLDGDDYFASSDLLERCVTEAIKRNSQVLVTDYIADYRKTQTYHAQPVPAMGQDCARALLRGETKGFLWNKCFDRAHYKSHAMPHKAGQNLLEDFRALFPLLLHTERVDYLPIPSVHYEQTNTSSYITTIKLEDISQLFTAVDDCVEYVTANNFDWSMFRNDFEVAYLAIAKMLFDKVPYSQYAVVKHYRQLNPNRIDLMSLSLYDKYCLRCQISDFGLSSRLGYCLCAFKRWIKKILRS